MAGAWHVIFALIVLVAAFGVAVQIAGIAFANAEIARRGCPDCRKGAICARCLAESEAIRPQPEREAA